MNNGVWAGATAETIRQPQDRSKGHPQERQHSAAAGGTRDRVPPARGAVCASGMDAACRNRRFAGSVTTARPGGHGTRVHNAGPWWCQRPNIASRFATRTPTSRVLRQWAPLNPVQAAPIAAAPWGNQAVAAAKTSRPRRRGQRPARFDGRATHSLTTAEATCPPAAGRAVGEEPRRRPDAPVQRLARVGQRTSHGHRQRSAGGADWDREPLFSIQKTQPCAER